jgi:hypothetical protein
MKQTLFILILFIPLCSCDQVSHTGDDGISGLWNFQGSGGDKNDIEEEAYLNLRKDKTYTFYQPYYFDYGHWTYKDKKIKLVSDRKKILYLKEWELDVVDMDKDVLKIKFPFADTADKLPGLLKEDLKEKIMYTVHKNIFLNRNNVQYELNKDPFSLQYSKWRIHPDHKESCAEVKQRVIDNMEHLCLFLDVNSKSDAKSISFRHSPHPFFFASNGISIDNNSQLPDEWINTFYDFDNETDAYFMISKLFDEDIDIPLHYQKYSELWYSILNQMYTIARKKDLCTAISGKQTEKNK